MHAEPSAAEADATADATSSSAYQHPRAVVDRELVLVRGARRRFVVEDLRLVGLAVDRLCEELLIRACMSRIGRPCFHVSVFTALARSKRSRRCRRRCARATWVDATAWRDFRARVTECARLAHGHATRGADNLCPHACPVCPPLLFVGLGVLEQRVYVVHGSDDLFGGHEQQAVGGCDHPVVGASAWPRQGVSRCLTEPPVRGRESRQGSIHPAACNAWRRWKLTQFDAQPVDGITECSEGRREVVLAPIASRLRGESEAD